jgi:diadenylate cyclase
MPAQPPADPTTIAAALRGAAGAPAAAGLAVGWRDLVQVALVAWAAYHVLLRLRGRRALQLVLVVGALGSAYVLAWALGLTVLTWLIGALVVYAPVVALVAFQPELRAAVQQLTQTRSARLVRSLDAGEVADEIADAAERLSRSSTGAIIAVERDLPLGDVLETGTPLNAKVSGDLLATIFTPYSPLHDGAVVIRGDTIVGAGCILPLAQTRIDDRSLGTRHRAALGLTEESDALVVVVSEETGTISLASGGRLVRDLGASQLRDVLTGRVPRTTTEHATVALGD